MYVGNVSGREAEPLLVMWNKGFATGVRHAVVGSGKKSIEDFLPLYLRVGLRFLQGSRADSREEKRDAKQERGTNWNPHPPLTTSNPDASAIDQQVLQLTNVPKPIWLLMVRTQIPDYTESGPSASVTLG